MISYNYICLLGITKSQGIKKKGPAFICLACSTSRETCAKTHSFAKLTMTLLVYILPRPVLSLLLNMCKEQHLTSIISLRRELKPICLLEIH